MMKNIKRGLLFIIYLVIAQLSIADVSIITKLDSSILLMGKQTVIHLELVQDIAQKGKFINEPIKGDSISHIINDIEYVGLIRNDTTIISNNKYQINRDYLIQSFDSGLYTIPPFKYIVGIDTFMSNDLTLKVVPVQVDSIFNKITNYAEIESVEHRWWDYIPDQISDNWILIVVCAIILMGVLALIYLYRINKTNALKIKNIPPHELALVKLNQLKEQKLCENGREKEYYTQLTDILREYLANRFGINALEMTSFQIMESIQRNEEVKSSQSDMATILEIADFVKFAKVKPLPEDNLRTYQSAIKFINDTKPLEQSEDGNNINDN